MFRTLLFPLSLFLFSLSLHLPFVLALPEVTHHEDGRVRITLNGTVDLQPRRIELIKWDGCGDGPGSKKQEIIDAWIMMLEMAGKIKGNIQFDTPPARDYLGDPEDNANHQKHIRDIIENVATWQIGGILDWHLEMYCNDHNRRGMIECPPGTRKEDRYMCGSRCYKPKKDKAGNLIGWGIGARAYTVNYKGIDVGYMNWCPSWFELPKCIDAYAKWSRLGNSKWDLTNYLCREFTMVHELFHIDANSAHVSPTTGHVFDRKIKVYSDVEDGKIETKDAYGPVYAKVLANWTRNVGFYVATNADSLALYFLSRWIELQGGFYPDRPWVKTRPLGPPTQKLRHRALRARQDPVKYDPLAVNGTTVALNDRSDLAIALQVPIEDVENTYDYAGADLGCFDMEAEMGADPANDQCYDDANNAPLDLDGTLESVLDNGDEQPEDGDVGQQIAVASYINPIGDPAAWKRLLSYDTNKITVLVANVLNGPDYVVEPNWASVIQQAASQGKTIIGYVRTGYLGVSQQKFTTRLGSNDLADWASQIEQDIDKWYELYGGSLGGIFFDEGWPECGPNNIYADLYKRINDYTKRKHPGAYTVLNPGSPIASCYEDTMDTLLTFESSYQTYLNSYVPNDWIPKDARKIWHIIYKTPQDQIQAVTQLAKERHVGLVEVTDDDNPNPYDNLPSEAYMQAAMDALAGGKLRKYEPDQAAGVYVAGTPQDLRVVNSDYSSITLTWSPVANALGYAIYKDGALTLELPASLTRATVGMLNPGTSNIQFEVRSLLSSGSGSDSKIVTASTTSLPASGIIDNVKYTKEGDTVVYTADVLVPYAFVRLFIAGPQPDIGYAKGWPIAKLKEDGSQTGLHMVVNYLIEGNDFYSGLYRYTGKYYETTSENADWSWASIGTASQTQSGRRYTWRVPLGGTDAIPSNYVIQGQGYAPLTNVFVGELRRYGTAP